MLILNSCKTIQVPIDIQNSDLYYLKGPSGAVKMHFLTSGQSDLTVEEWDLISEGMVAMPLSSWDAFNTEIGKLCTQSKCNYETVQTLKKFNDFFAELKALQKTESP